MDTLHARVQALARQVDSLRQRADQLEMSWDPRTSPSPVVHFLRSTPNSITADSTMGSCVGYSTRRDPGREEDGVGERGDACLAPGTTARAARRGHAR